MRNKNLFLLLIFVSLLFFNIYCGKDDFSEITDPPILITPEDESTTTDTTPYFTWTIEGNTKSVEEYLIELDGATLAVTNGDQFQYQPTESLSVGEHRWRVIAKNDFQMLPSAETFTFYIGNPSAVDLLLPADHDCITTDTPTFTWNGVENASQYIAEIATDNEFQDIV
jgi:hypothetical protein